MQHICPREEDHLIVDKDAQKILFHDENFWIIMLIFKTQNVKVCDLNKCFVFFSSLLLSFQPHFLLNRRKLQCKAFSRKGHLQDGGGVRHGDHLPPHKYIKNTSTCGTTPTEQLLNTGRRPQTSQKARTSTHTWVMQ